MHHFCQYLHIRKTPSGVQTNGTVSCMFGNENLNEKSNDSCSVFAEWIWDGNQLTVRNDYSGYYPLFYYADANQIMVSDFIVKLIALGAPTYYDEEALSVFCRCGFFLAEHTPFREIHVLLPNATLQWREGSLSVEGGVTITRAQKLTQKEVVDGYIELFRKAMERCQPLNEEFALPLSGGHDSRQILLELHRQGKLPKVCVTCGEERDIAVAGILADRMNLNHHILVSDYPWTKCIWRKNIATHFCTLEHAWLMELGDYLTANFKESYDGTGVGEITRNYYSSPELLDLYEAGRFDDVAVWIFKRLGPPEDFFNLLRGRISFIAENKDRAIELVAHELELYSGAANPLASFNFWNRNRRALALSPFGIQSRVQRVNTPFLDKDLYDFVSSFEPGLILEREPQATAIKKAFPKFAHIPLYNELPKKKQNKSKIFKRCRNAFDSFLVIAKNNAADLPAMWRAQMWPKSEGLALGYTTSAQDRSKIISVLVYLAELSACSSQWRAQRMLFNYSKFEGTKADRK